MVDLDYFYFSDSYIENYELLDRDLIVKIANLQNLSTGQRVSGKLTFKNVKRSAREIFERIEDPSDPSGFSGFKDHVVETVELSELSEDASEYCIEGSQAIPPTWIDWVIVATSVEFEEDV